MDRQTVEATAARPLRPRSKGLWWALAALVVVLVIVVACVLWIASPSAASMARERTIRALEENFASKIEWQTLEVSIFPRVLH